MNEREDELLVAVWEQLKRIADALDRAIPVVLDRSKVTPAGPDALTRPTLADLAQWEKDEADQRSRIG